MRAVSEGAEKTRALELATASAKRRALEREVRERRRTCAESEKWARRADAAANEASSKLERDEKEKKQLEDTVRDSRHALIAERSEVQRLRDDALKVGRFLAVLS